MNFSGSNITQKALQKIKDILGNKDCFIRISVVGGGCSGYMYKMDFTNEIGVEDKVFFVDGIGFVIDKKSGLFLNGVTLDYDDSNPLNFSGFTWHNPNAKRTCGCGNSFNT